MYVPNSINIKEKYRKFYEEDYNYIISKVIMFKYPSNIVSDLRELIFIVYSDYENIDFLLQIENFIKRIKSTSYGDTLSSYQKSILNSIYSQMKIKINSRKVI